MGMQNLAFLAYVRQPVNSPAFILRLKAAANYKRSVLIAKREVTKGGIAQLVERSLCKADASGSNPLTSRKN